MNALGFVKILFIASAVLAAAIYTAALIWRVDFALINGIAYPPKRRAFFFVGICFICYAILPFCESMITEK